MNQPIQLPFDDMVRVGGKRDVISGPQQGKSFFYYPNELHLLMAYENQQKVHIVNELVTVDSAKAFARKSVEAELARRGLI